MADIKDYLAESGNLLNGKGEVKNVADILVYRRYVRRQKIC